MAADLLKREVYYNNGSNQSYSSNAPAGVQYVVIRAYGAGGGGETGPVVFGTCGGGAGAYVEAKYNITSGISLSVIPGGAGGSYMNNGGGGGATIVRSDNLLLVAGGGGGGVGDALYTTDGQWGAGSGGLGGSPVGGNPSSGGATGGTLTSGGMGQGSGGSGNVFTGGDGGGTDSTYANTGGFNGGGKAGRGSGGGGGGYYGGGGGVSGGNSPGSPGGGGSSFASENASYITYSAPISYSNVTFYVNAYGDYSPYYDFILKSAVTPPSTNYTATPYFDNNIGGYVVDYGVTIDPSVVSGSYTTESTDPTYAVPAYTAKAGMAIMFDALNQRFYAGPYVDPYNPGLQITYSNINNAGGAATLGSLGVGRGGLGATNAGPGAAVIEYYGTIPPPPPPPPPPVVYDPTGYYGGVTPTLVVLGGDGQASVAGQYNLQPFDVAVWNAAGSAPLVGAPVQFSVDSGGGLLASSASGGGASSLALVTDVDGTAMAYYQQPATSGIFSLIHVRAGASQYVFTTSSYGASAVYPDADGDGIPDAAEISLGTNRTTPAQIVPASTLNLSVYTP